jgi:hypothetical protein
MTIEQDMIERLPDENPESAYHLPDPRVADKQAVITPF